MTQLSFGRDVQGFNAFAPPFSSNTLFATLVNAGNASFTIPSNAAKWIIVFAYVVGTEIWVANNTTAAPPASSSFTATASELFPSARTVNAGDVINVYNNGTAGNVEVILYAIA